MDTIEKELVKEKPSVIALKKDVKLGLDKLKVHHRETYSEVIERLIQLATIQEPKKIITPIESVEEKKSEEFSVSSLF